MAADRDRAFLVPQCESGHAPTQTFTFRAIHTDRLTSSLVDDPRSVRRLLASQAISKKSAEETVLHETSQRSFTKWQETLQTISLMNRPGTVQCECALQQFGQNLVPGARFALQSAQLPGTKAVPHWAQYRPPGLVAEPHFGHDGPPAALLVDGVEFEG